ncbi:beta-eliminating lyase-related protein [Saccharopolyspora sp. K220]|uniref:threonine aldolase family protein n=1 Tax=Saccharopolyspora soli TaxID=2926618 RepID=UPI001F5A3625|nr:beta-eliminating lyase-related protein [Saccharopolyspora soli]MCI2420983.1 beta-eliminating lyase-related protein [Saccharopolyspora soli]
MSDASVRSLALHDPRLRLPAERLRVLLSRVDEDELPDDYGRGGAVQRLEDRMATLLGKEAAVFMPTGAMASQVALRLHADIRTTRVIGFHPRAHIEVHERKGYAVVHQLIGKQLGDHDRLLTLDELEAVREPLAAVLWELPQRDLGGLLPEWDSLVAQTAWARERGIAAHLDGARIWEAQPYYGRSHAEIAELFDTVYVSLYKSLGGLGGAILAGPAALVEHAREWRARLGGQLHNAWPLAMSAEAGLDSHLPRMHDYWMHARELAAALSDVPGVSTVPHMPQTPLFHVHIDAPREALDAAHAQLIHEGGMRLYRYSRTTTHPERSRFEVTVGADAMRLPVEDVRDAIDELARAARQHHNA